MEANGHQLGVRAKEEPMARVGGQVATSVGTLLAVAVAAFVLAAPFTWALMLFLGNLGLTGASFWDCLPGGALVGMLVAGRTK